MSDISTQHILTALMANVFSLPPRAEGISGQSFKYVKLGDVLALIEEASNVAALSTPEPQTGERDTVSYSAGFEAGGRIERERGDALEELLDAERGAREAVILAIDGIRAVASTASKHRGNIGKEAEFLAVILTRAKDALIGEVRKHPDHVEALRRLAEVEERINRLLEACLPFYNSILPDDTTISGWRIGYLTTADDARNLRSVIDDLSAPQPKVEERAREDERDRLLSLAFDHTISTHPYSWKSWAEGAKCWLKDNGAMFPSERAALRAKPEAQAIVGKEAGE